MGLAQFRDGRLKIFCPHTNISEIHPENIFRGVRLVLRLSSLLSQRPPQNSAKPRYVMGKFKNKTSQGKQTT
jgi:hypothetical protein